MNIKLLEQIKAKITAEPKQFFMSWFYGDGLAWDIPNCGTAACIAGWAVALSNGQNPKEAYGTPRFMTGESLKVLELDRDQGERLFNHFKWPEPYLSLYHEDGSAESAKVACDRIDFFIKTNGTDKE